MLKQLLELFTQHNIFALTLAFAIGSKVSALVSSFVAGILMPFLTGFLNSPRWELEMLRIGPFHFRPWPFLGASVDFLIVVALFFLFMKSLGTKKQTRRA